MAASSTRKKTLTMKTEHTRYFIIYLCLATLHGIGSCTEAPGLENCIDGVETHLLKKYNPWTIASEDRNTTYRISLCDKLKPTSSKDIDCNSQSSICMKTVGEKPASVGEFNTMKLAKSSVVGEFTVIFTGEPCPLMPKFNLTTLITFKCGPTLGSPEFQGRISCSTIILWRTSAACKNIERPASEVPCYVLDDKHFKRNLSPLALKKGGYIVESAQDSGFYINICRDIKGDTKVSGSTADHNTVNCPAGTGACLLQGGKYVDVGQPKQKLQMSESGSLLLQYTTDTSVPGCKVNPSTTIEFKCPKLGGSKDPLLVARYNCQYKILWVTEHACPETDITSKTCKLVRPEYDLNIDLTPLKHQRGDKQYSAGDGQYTFYINICGDLGIQCPDMKHVENVAACQTKIGDSSFGKVIGRADEMLLRYADGDLSLTYRDGEKCHTNMGRTTIINFVCDRNVNGTGFGIPTFKEEVNNSCTYIFEWKTKYACSDHPSFEQCRVDHNGNRYDLSPLVRRKGTDWEIVHSGNNIKGRFFMNVCNDLLNSGPEARCHPEAVVCLIDGEGAHNLGKYTSNPVYDEESKGLKITYSGGDSCGTGKLKQSVVKFICKPGDLESGPVLLDVSLDNCLYTFMWETAAACVLSHSTGGSCKVFDEKAGFNFDLTPLQKSTDAYIVPSPNGTYDYKINVCGPVKGTKCDTSTTTPGAAVCQEKRDSNQAINCGKPPGILTYFDGMLNLTYTDGQPYNSKPPVSRTTEIAFLCDHSAGAGNITFLEESERTYSFEWFTAYACPNVPVECTVTDPEGKQQYDLSGLSRTETRDDWQFEHFAGATKYKYYINVCRSLNQVHVGTGCDPFAAACRTKFVSGKEVLDPDMTNMGSVTSRPIFVSKGQLELRYKSKTKNCNNGQNYTTTAVHFFCRKGAVTTGPSNVEKLSSCEYVITWNTEAACPLEDTVSSSKCEIKDRNSDYIFNLLNLKKNGDKDYYSVKSGTDEYRLNICGASTACDKVEGKPASMCHVKSDGTTDGLTFEPFTLDYSDDGTMVLKYDGKRVDQHKITVEIMFICKQNVDLGEPKFSRIEENHRYMFTMETSLVCKPDFVECKTEDSHGNRYDLTGLARGASDFNWQVLDTRDSFKSVLYHINVCRPVNNIAGTSCPGGPVGACQQPPTGHSFNMGYIHSQPIAAEDGTVTLHYRNGDLCHKGTPNEAHRSTRIIFTCSGVEHNPVFQGETEACEYIFDWQTPYACPLKEPTRGTNCKVHEPLNQFEFDLNPLRRSHDYHVNGSGYDFVMNMCGALQEETCGGQSGVAVCQTKKDDPKFKIVAGKATSDLSYSSGAITLTYTDGKGNCHGKYNRSAIITFICDQDKEGTDGPVFTDEALDCTYLFQWSTKHACPPFKVGDCTYRDSQENSYDFSSMALSSSNYGYTDFLHKKKYILNVCRTLVHTKGETCPYNAAACEIDFTQVKEEAKKYKNIGEISEHMIREKDHRIFLYYTNGDPCNATTKWSTEIELVCQKNALLTTPTGEFDLNCVHHFWWYSASACPLGQQQGGTTVIPSNKCTAVNPATGHVFDLTSLKKPNGGFYEADSNRGQMFKLNVCDRVSGTTCTDATAAVCQEEKVGEKRAFNSGKFNTGRLLYDHGILSLNYSGGTPCHNKQFSRSTIINFVCSEGAGKGHPVFIDESDDCTYYFSWHTELVCEEKVKCSVDTGSSTIDLSPLVKKEGFYMAVTDVGDPSDTKTFSTYYINICRPLNPMYGTLCPPEASACIQSQNAKPKSLGKLKKPPYMMDNGKVVIEYTGGDKCPGDVGKNMSTKVIFSCKRDASQGKPVLLERTKDCQYVFVWDTDVVCPQSTEHHDCVFQDPYKPVTYDLNVLQKVLQQTQPIEKDGARYHLSFCGSVQSQFPGCKGTSICRENGTVGHGFGLTSTAKLIRNGNMLSMTYRNGEKCQGDRQSEGLVSMSCKATDIGTPEYYYYTKPCMVHLSWSTCLACPNTSPCLLRRNGHEFDLTMLSSQTGGWGLTDANGNKYKINICQAVHNGPQSKSKCPNLVAAWRQRTNGQVDSLGLINTQIITGDGNTISVEYSEGDVACSSGKRRSENPAAKTIITFECGSTVGGPQFIGVNQDTCVFQFHWKSKVACSLVRQNVKDVNLKVIDPKTSSMIDLNKLSKQSISSAKSTYSIDITGKANGCTDSVVCLTESTSTGNTDIGTFSTRKFYFEDGILEGVFTTNKPCPTYLTKYVKSIITFSCSETEKIPSLLYQTSDCTRLFEWQTPVACVKPVVVMPQPLPVDKTVTGSAGSPESRPKTVAIVVSVFAVAIVICVLLIVFHKKERRDSFKNRVRNLFGSDGRDRYRYGPIPDLEDGEADDSILDAANDTVTDELDNEEIVSINSTSQVRSYHDDSDEDLLE